MKCSECKYFHKLSDLHGQCSCEKFKLGYATNFVDYDVFNSSATPWSVIPPDGVNVEDDEGWGFLVGKDFGCIHFDK